MNKNMQLYLCYAYLCYFMKNISVIGPKKDGALLEGSKDFSKQFMQKHGVPTAKYQSFTKENLEEIWS